MDVLTSPDRTAAPAARRTWRLGARELAALTRRTGTRAPFPLAVPPLGHDGLPEVERGLRVRGLLDAAGAVEPALATALRTLAGADGRVDALGWYPGGEADLVRVAAGAQQRRGVLALQLPGPDARTAGEVLLREVDPASLGAEVAASLPAAPPGGHRPLRCTRTAPDGDAAVRRSTDGADAAELAALLTGARSGGGQLAVTVAAPGQEPRREQAARWHDRAGDGRYLVAVAGDEVRVEPVGCRDLGAALDAALRRLADRVTDAPEDRALLR